MKHDLESNKQNAIAFYRMSYLGNPSKAVEDYAGDEYIQHNPLVADGKQAFIDYFEEMARDYPGKSIEFVRAISQGDLVALHTHQIWPGNKHYVTIDFFRFDENGKIVEHWDSMQEVPDESKIRGEFIMLALQEIEKEILTLAKEDFSRLREWFYAKDFEKWDEELKEDSESGKLDFLIEEAEKESGTLKKL